MTGGLIAVALGCGVVLSALMMDATRAGKEVPPATPEEVSLPTHDIWDGPAPGAKGQADEDRPCISVLRADPARACGTAVIVCPGGGYNVRAMDYEGLQVAQWLNGIGVDAFLLSYRVKKFGYTPDDALADGQRAVRWVRHHAAEFGIDPRRIGMVGFSAGGHLIARVAEEPGEGVPDAADPVERESSRPDFLMLIYAPLGGHRPIPAIVKTSPAQTAPPPAFIFHTSGDTLIPAEGALNYYRELRAAGAEAELHIFGGYGPHGIGLASGLPGAQEWPRLAASWMRRNAFLTGKERVSVRGRVTVDDESVGTAWVTFYPIDSESEPIAAARTNLADGTFSLDAADGPVTGRHRVEVRQVCRQFLTVPSQAEEHVYTELSPDAQGPIVVLLEPGENTVNIAIRTR